MERRAKERKAEGSKREQRRSRKRGIFLERGKEQRVDTALRKAGTRVLQGIIEVERTQEGIQAGSAGEEKKASEKQFEERADEIANRGCRCRR